VYIVGTRRPCRRADRPCGWHDRLATICGAIGDLDWHLTRSERRQLERVAADWRATDLLPAA